jgi:hypothetical protein
MRFAAAPLALLLILAALSGCGSSSSSGTTSGSGAPQAGTSTAPAGASAQSCPLNLDGIKALRVTGVPCGEATRVASGWRSTATCAKSGSRSGCSVRSYRCAATASGRGWSVSCAKPGRSIAFTARRD